MEQFLVPRPMCLGGDGVAKSFGVTGENNNEMNDFYAERNLCVANIFF